MDNLTDIKKRIGDMAQTALAMWRTSHRVFLEHDVDLISEVLSHENKLNDMEKEITVLLIGYGRACSDAREKHQVTIYADIVGDIELIGDYCKDILERVQIKIEEKLFFSDEAVSDYEELYRKTESALDEVAVVLQRDNLSIVNDVLKKEEHLDSLVDAYRARHDQRLLSGACSPMAGNMFINMLDFTAAVYYHVKKIARNLRKIRQ